MSAARSRAVAGKLIDAFVDRVYERAPVTAFLPLTKWRTSWAAKSEDGTHAARVTSALSQSGDAWSKAAFLEHVSSSYETLLDALSAGDESNLRDVSSDALFPWLRRGMREGIAEHGARQGARVLRWLEPPRIVQWRSVHAAPEATRRFFDLPDFAQVTVRCHTLQRPTAHAVPAPRGGGGDADARQSLSAPPPGTWHPVLDAGSGLTYWVNDTTGAVSVFPLAYCGKFTPCFLPLHAGAVGSAGALAACAALPVPHRRRGL